jgi:hypothetical protein
MVLATNPFKPATKEASKVRLALTGPSGSGKTWTALLIAETLAQIEGGNIAFIDTEGRSARKYGHRFSFDVLDLTGDYSPAKYIDGIKASIDNGYKVLVIDSLSHGWNATGGVLEIVDKAAEKMSDNKWAGWSKGRPVQNALVETIVGASAHIHIIVTMRARTEWVIIQGGDGKKSKPEKVGLEPVQSSDMEYEFDLAATMTMDHALIVTKSRCEDLPLGEYTNIDHFTRTMHAWASDGETPAPLRAKDTYLASQAGKNRLSQVLRELGATKTEHYAPYLQALGISAFSETMLSESQLHAELRQIAKTLKAAQGDDKPGDKPKNEPPANNPPKDNIRQIPPQQPEPPKQAPPAETADKIDAKAFFEWAFKIFMLSDTKALEALDASVNYRVSKIDDYNEPKTTAMAAVIAAAHDYDAKKVEAYTSSMAGDDNFKHGLWEEAQRIIELNKQDAPPSKPATVSNWTVEDNIAIHQYLFDIARLDSESTLESMGKSDWSDFGTVKKAQEAVRAFIIENNVMMVATKFKFEGNYVELNTVFKTRHYGFDGFRALDGEDETTWSTAVESWKLLAKGSKGDLPRPLIVGWKKGANGGYYEVTELIVISEQDDDWGAEPPQD